MSLVDRLLSLVTALNSRETNKPHGIPSLEPDSLKFLLNEGVKASEVALLRESVGWDGREDKYEQILKEPFAYSGCFDDTTLVGFCRAISDGVDDAVIFDLAVLPAYRHSGVGSKLVDLVIAYCSSVGVKAVCVLFESQLAPFYQKRGFFQLCGGVMDTELMDGPWRKEIL